MQQDLDKHGFGNIGDTKVIENASALDFIVLDELHTYRGRQGADVAILVRRLRNRCKPDNAPICIGTSATMASEGSDTNRARAVADAVPDVVHSEHFRVLTRRAGEEREPCACSVR
jgi:ATP-dependent helicase YprA (DUF1998 family)